MQPSRFFVAYPITLVDEHDHCAYSFTNTSDDSETLALIPSDAAGRQGGRPLSWCERSCIQRLERSNAIERLERFERSHPSQYSWPLIIRREFQRLHKFFEL
jgi:hypothetical protein